LIPVVLQLVTSRVLAQDSNPSGTGQRCVMISGFAGPAIPGGDLSQDYGTFWEIGAGALYQNSSRWLFGLDFSYMFGSDVRKDPVPNLRTPDGNIISTDGTYAFFKAFQRGFMFPMVRFGKTISLVRKPVFNQLGGLTLMGGAAWLQHWTYIQDISKKTPQFSSEYLEGYDRLTSGPGVGAWVGYLYLPERGKLNFHLEAGYFYGFTQSQRFDFVTEKPAGQKRNDSLFQLKLRICFTIRSRPEDTFYYN